MQDFSIGFPAVSLFENFPHDKIDFIEIDQDKPLYRSHNSKFSWLFFDESNEGRFNGYIPDNVPKAIKEHLIEPFGGCYVAGSSIGAISESIFRNIHQVEKKFIERSLLSSRRMSKIFMPDGVCLKLVDLTSGRTRTQLGLDTQIFSTPDYDVCFVWAHLFRLKGYDGIKYRGRNLEYECYVLFTNDILEEDFGESLGLLDSECILCEVQAIAAGLGVFVENMR
ncbi:hypothetical protein BOO22_14670 [Vibrio cidicii]|uniref:RES domain-containing protein n=1 Tax=Vibrio cidicii TaxID=1763883 RepID=UPI0018C2CC35|nr:RES domain-containing protein [Vibrio cidicii]MBG0760655.1 hypothetical protein [Vibrio cidicii]